MIKDLLSNNKILAILDKKQKLQGAFLFLLILIAMVFETMGIALIVPFLSLIMTPDGLSKYPAVKDFIFSFGNFSHPQIVVIAAIFMSTIFAFKSLYLTFKNWMQYRFVFALWSNLSERLFSDYLHRPYLFHLQVNSAKLMQNIEKEVHGVTIFLVNALVLITELLVIFGLAFLMFYVNTQAALIIIVLFSIYGGFMFFYYRNRLLKLGFQRQNFEGEARKNAQEGFGGIKEIKLFGVENYFINQYKKPIQELISVNTKHQLSLEIPKIWIEFFVISVFSVLMVLMIYQNLNVVGLIPTLGMFAAIAFRIMPSVSRTLYSIQEVKFYNPSFKILNDEFSLFNDSNITSSDVNLFSFDKEISVQDVSYTYEGSDKKILNNVNAIIPKGSLVGFVGSSGAGKSTLLDVLLGLISPDTGSIKIDGIDINDNIYGWQKSIGYVSQTVYLTDSTIKSNIAFGLDESSIDNNLLKNAIESAQLQDFIDGLPNGIETFVGERGVKLSGGQRQRIGIARALYNNPEVLVLDEASSALDINTETRFLKTIKSLSGYKTIIFVTHRESVMNFCDQVYIQKNQKLSKM